MAQIYEQGLWGKDDSGFYSGDGSHDSTFVDPYVEKVTSFLSSFEEPPVVCDLGCGDFNVGKQLAPYTSKYFGIDIVPDLIERNKNLYKQDKVEFKCLNISEDSLPDGNVAILRNVLQHLSNAEIKKILPKLFDYRYIILTEHLPNGEFRPNRDIISGQGIRLKKQSGVDLISPPFNLDVKVTQWLSVPSKDWGGKVVTAMLQMMEDS